MKSLNTRIFKGKKFSDLLEEIYNNQQKKSNIIETLISELKPLVKDIGDATLLVPLIKEYLDIGIKNDDQLVKIATIIQRLSNNDNSSPGGSLGISDEEKEQLLKEVEKIHKKSNDSIN